MLRAASRAKRAEVAEPPAPATAPSARDLAAASLRLELLATGAASDGRAAWHVADGLAAGLVAVEAGELAPVHPDELVAWGLGREEAFHLASANVRGAPLPAVTSHAPSGGAELVFVSGPDATASAHALWLDDLVGGVPAAGALVAVPHQRAVLAHRLSRWDHAVEAVNLLVMMADAAWAQGTAPVSPDLYWWHDGWFTSLAARLVDGDVQVDAPPAFLDALERLPRL